MFLFPQARSKFATLTVDRVSCVQVHDTCGTCFQLWENCQASDVFGLPTRTLGLHEPHVRDMYKDLSTYVLATNQLC